MKNRRGKDRDERWSGVFQPLPLSKKERKKKRQVLGDAYSLEKERAYSEKVKQEILAASQARKQERQIMEIGQLPEINEADRGFWANQLAQNNEELIERMRGRDASPMVVHRDLREGRPDPPKQIEPRGVLCERCERLTERIECLYETYWLCPGCVKAHTMAAIRSRLMNAAE